MQNEWNRREVGNLISLFARTDRISAEEACSFRKLLEAGRGAEALDTLLRAGTRLHEPASRDAKV